jgi:Plasmid encoded RepA protein
VNWDNRSRPAVASGLSPAHQPTTIGPRVPCRPMDQRLGDLLTLIPEEVRQDIGYTGRVMAQATLPHKNPGADVRTWVRSNGAMRLVVEAGFEQSLPFGSLPRLLMSWVTTEAVRTKERQLVLGHTLSAFLEELGLGRHGGQRGDITRLRRQMQALFSARISVFVDEPGHWQRQSLEVATTIDLWWDHRKPHQGALWASTITLSHDFFEDIIRRPIPVDLRALKLLKRSPLALDLYAWLTWRYSYLRDRTTVPWEALQLQFGADYGRQDNFKAAVQDVLAKVTKVYPNARCRAEAAGLVLLPSPTHVPKLRS